MTPHRITHLPLITCALALGLALAASPADAWAKRKSGTYHSTQIDKPRKGVRKVTYQRSTSEETPAQRDQRLRRECKGMNNAGACLGYTR
jgi:hypothetical protein